MWKSKKIGHEHERLVTVPPGRMLAPFKVAQREGRHAFQAEKTSGKRSENLEGAEFQLTPYVKVVLCHALRRSQSFIELFRALTCERY